MNLTEEQSAIYQAVLDGIPSCPVQSIGGYAGTGQTVLVSEMACGLPRFAVAAFTGKAANVLREKGVKRAQTIHSLIYHVEDKVVVEMQTQPDGTKRRRISTVPEYHLRDLLPDVEGILVDEASMVTAQLYSDLLTFGLPIVFVGDHGQLPPVGDDPGVMTDPDYRLETIHRNANEIAHFGAHVRQGNWASQWRQVPGAGKLVRFISPSEVIRHMKTTEQTIVAFNGKRVEFNRDYRKQVLGEVGNMPIAGDRLICLRNTRHLKLFNGQQVTAKLVTSTKLIQIQDDEGKNKDVDYTCATFNQVKPDFDRSPHAPVPFDFAYAITCHKSQGSEWSSGLVLEQFCPWWEHARWAYTAATRFKNKLYWTNPKWKT